MGEGLSVAVFSGGGFTERCGVGKWGGGSEGTASDQDDILNPLGDRFTGRRLIGGSKFISSVHQTFGVRLHFCIKDLEIVTMGQSRRGLNQSHFFVLLGLFWASASRMM